MLYSAQLSHRKLMSQSDLLWVPLIRGKEHNYYVFQMHLIKHTLAGGALLSRSRHRAQRETGLRHSHQVAVLNNFSTRARCQFLPQGAAPRQTCQQKHEVQCMKDDHQYTWLQRQTGTDFYFLPELTTYEKRTQTFISTRVTRPKLIPSVKDISIDFVWFYQE